MDALRPESKPIFGKLIGSLKNPDGKVETQSKGDRKLVVITASNGQKIYWWVEKNEDLVISDNPDPIIAALDGKSPDASNHPVRTALVKAEGAFAPIAVAFLDFEASPGALASTTALLGKIDLTGLKRFEYRVGTEGEAIREEVRLVAPNPRSGILAMFDQPKFDAKNLPPMPESVNTFFAASLDFAKLYGQIRDLAKASKSSAAETIASMESSVKAKGKMKLREDVLGRIGPRFVMYAQPEKAKAGPLSNIGVIGLQVPTGAILIEMKDAKATPKMVDDLISYANKEMKARMAASMPAEPEGTPKKTGRSTAATKKAAPSPEFKSTIGPPKMFTLHLPTQFAAMTNVKLTVAVGKKYIAIGSSPIAAKDALATETKTKTGPLASSSALKAIEGVPSGLILLAVDDPKETLPDSLANYPEHLQAILDLRSALAGAPVPLPDLAGQNGDRNRQPTGPGGQQLPLRANPGGGGAGSTPPPGDPNSAASRPGGTEAKALLKFMWTRANFRNRRQSSPCCSLAPRRSRLTTSQFICFRGVHFSTWEPWRLETRSLRCKISSKAAFFRHRRRQLEVRSVPAAECRLEIVHRPAAPAGEPARIGRIEPGACSTRTVRFATVSRPCL